MHLHDLERELADSGYLLHHCASSHRQYRHTQSGQLISVSYHHGGSDRRALGQGKVRAVRQDIRRQQRQRQEQRQQQREEVR